MKFPKTIKGYINMMKRIEKELSPSLLKGFDELDDDTKETLEYLDAEISNYINEIKQFDSNKSK